ncbi:hypothetical protein HS7_05520 [Sulfolobales archaeon HS-7]|nr:hypothetical protein HS7_05520 [Sulfolobales archaeon HS-7]
MEIKVSDELWPRRKDWSGEVVEVLVKEGQRVKKGDVICEIEIEKAVLQLESPIDGIIRKVFIKSGDEVKPNTLLMVIE